MAITSVVNEEGVPVEIAPGRGDLRRGSFPFVQNLPRSLQLVDRHVSFARIFATQPLIGSAVGWKLRQARRVPLKAYRRDTESASRRLYPGEHPLADAISTPWERAAQIQLVAALLGSKEIHGNAVCPVESGAKGAIRFQPKDWRYSIPLMPWRDTVSGWEIDTDQPDIRQTLSTDTVLFIRDYSPLGPLGLSPLEQLGVTVAIEDAAQRHQRATLQNGARPPSAVEADKEFLGLREEERDKLLGNLREDLNEIYAGPDNAGRPALLPPGLTWKPVGHTAVEVELIEQRKVNRVEAGGVYGLTPSAVGVVERGAELPEQRQMNIVEGLAPELILIEALMNAQVVQGMMRDPEVFVEFDFAGVLRGDKLREIEALRDAIGSAMMSPREARDVLNLPTDNLPPEMAKFYLPRNNLIPVDMPYQPKGLAVGGDPAKPADEEGA